MQKKTLFFIFIILSTFKLFGPRRLTVEDYFIHERAKQTYIPTITVLAQQMGFYSAKNKLLNKVQEYLNTIELQMKKNIQDWHRQRRVLLAINKEEEYFDIYEYLLEKFDRAFLKWDEYLITLGDYLDRINATEAEKEKLVRDTLKGLETRINKIIAKTNKELNLSITQIENRGSTPQAARVIGRPGV